MQARKIASGSESDMRQREHVSRRGTLTICGRGLCVLPETLPDTCHSPSPGLVRLWDRLRRTDCGSFAVALVWVMRMRYCLVTRWPKTCSAMGCWAPGCWAIHCWPLRCRSCRMRSHHRLARCRQNPGCWGRWDRGRARLAPILEKRSWRSRTGRLAPWPVCSGRLSARR